MWKGFFWVANRPELVWEWSTAGASRRFAPYGRWMPPVDAKSGPSATTPNSNSDSCSDKGSGSGNVEPLTGAEPGSSERSQRLVFIGVDLRKARIPMWPSCPWLNSYREYHRFAYHRFPASPEFPASPNLASALFMHTAIMFVEYLRWC